MSEPLPFACALRAARERAGLSVAALAGRAGVSRQYLYELERDDKAASLEVACRLADALGCRLALVSGKTVTPILCPGQEAQ